MHIARWILSVAAAASVAGLVSAIPASAGWSARVTATGSVTVGQETVRVTPTAVSTVMTNNLYQTTYLVSVTNTQTSTTFAGTSNVTLSALPASTPVTDLGAALTAVIWPVASAAACTTAANPTPGAVSGPWSGGVTSGAVALAPQASALFCVRGHPTGGSSSSANSGQNRQTLASALGSPSGSTSFAPAFRADITLGDLTGQATGTSDPITTSQIYPFTVLSDLTTYYQVKPQNILSPAALCLDLRGGVVVGIGAPVDTFTCHDIGTDVSLGNQAVSMLPVAGMNAVQDDGLEQRLPRNERHRRRRQRQQQRLEHVEPPAVVDTAASVQRRRSAPPARQRRLRPLCHRSGGGRDDDRSGVHGYRRRADVLVPRRIAVPVIDCEISHLTCLN